jgi:hypothetical protein
MTEFMVLSGLSQPIGETLPHNHKRSDEAEARRFEAWQRRLKMWESQFTLSAFYDRKRSELISQNPVVGRSYEPDDPRLIIEEGEVLIDPYGEGVLQRIK